MKLYKDENTGEVTRVSSCEECPNRQAGYIWTFSGSKEGFVCKAIIRRSWRIGIEGKRIRYNPTINTSKTLYDCPLEDI